MQYTRLRLVYYIYTRVDSERVYPRSVVYHICKLYYISEVLLWLYGYLCIYGLHPLIINALLLYDP